MSWLELLHQAPNIIHHVAIHHQAVSTAAVDPYITASMFHEDSLAVALELTQKAIPQGIFTKEEVEQFIALVLAGTVTALMAETAINIRKTLTSQMRNQLIAAIASHLAKLQAEHKNIGVRVIDLVNRNATSKAKSDINKLKIVERSIEILKKLNDFLNADLSVQSAKVAVLAND